MRRTILRLDQIADRTGIPLATLRYHRHLRVGIPTFKLGRRVVAYEDEVEAYIEAQRAQADGARTA